MSSLPITGDVFGLCRYCGILAALFVAILSIAGAAPGSVSAGQLGRIDHVADGDTVDLTNGAKIRLVQIDTPEVYFSPECYGKKASAITKHLLPPGTLVRLTREPATDSVDSYGRLLRYVTRVRDGLNINVRLVAVGAAAPYSTAGAGAATPPDSRASLSRLVGATSGCGAECPGTPYNPDRASRPGLPAEITDGLVASSGEARAEARRSSSKQPACDAQLTRISFLLTNSSAP